MNVVVIKMQAVIAVPAFDAGLPPPWPVAAMPAWSWLTLAADCTAQQVGLFVAALARPLDDSSPRGRDEIVATLLAEELLIVPGGLRLADTVTGMTVVPGCCAGLEDWRDWARVTAGAPLWLGHDPGPEVEIVGDELRVWQDGGSAGTHLAVPLRMLPGLLLNVRRDLLGFPRRAR